jgi:pimeloyl-ACP methyl ester carboxylesterase
MRRRTWICAALGVLATATALGAAPSFASAQDERLGTSFASAQDEPPEAVGSVDWKACPNNPTVECGSAAVPIDWSKPEGLTIDIALARRKATDPGARVGALLINPGGPGVSGVDHVKGELDRDLPAEVLRRFDIIGFDPRGVGGSHSVRCQPPSLTSPADVLPATAEQFRRLREGNRADGESCRTLTGPLFDFLDNKSVVRDIDAIRAALGEPKLTFYGISYGTLMGQQYAQLFPQRVRAMVLDSNIDHSQATTWSFLRSEATAVQESFDQYVAWCQRSTDCALHGRDARRVFADLYAKAERGELTEPGTTKKIDPFNMLQDVQLAFADPSWKSLSERQADLLAGKPRADSALATRLEATPIQDSAGIFCADWRLPVHDANEVQSFRQRLASVAPDMKLPVGAWGATMRCQGWPAEVRNPQEPLHWTGVPPVLLLNSRYDPATPLEWAQSVARQTGATLLTYDGWGHGVYAVDSACTKAATEKYLISLQTPAPETHCPAVEPPTGQ